MHACVVFMTAQGAYFTVESSADEEFLCPQPAATSGWGEGVIRGPAITTALARALTRSASERPDLRPARITFDLHSPVPHRPLRTRANVLRSGRRLLLVDAELLVGESVFARARALFVGGGEHTTAGCDLLPSTLMRPPSDELGVPAPPGMLYLAASGEWTKSLSLSDEVPQAAWFSADPAVEGEPLDPFVTACRAADMGNLVVNWGPHGISEINADVSLYLARLPVGTEVGLVPSLRLAAPESVFGTATLFDRTGPFGSTSIMALPSVGGAISPTASYPSVERAADDSVDRLEHRKEVQ